MTKIRSNEDVFEKMPVGMAVRTMAVPAVISQLIVLIYNLADTFYIGQTNNPYMVAGVSLILPVFNVMIAVGALYGVGGGALLPKFLAVNRKDEATKVAAFCITLGFLTAAVFAVIMLVLLKPILLLLGAGPNTFDFASQYLLLVVVFGGVPTICSNVLSGLLRSLGMARESGIGVALGGVLNLALDPLFMFVILPAGNEVLGIGIATLLSNIIACVYCVWIYIRKQNVIKARLVDRMPESKAIRAIFAIGFPASLGGLLFDLDYMVLGRLASGYGDIPLAAMGIVLKAERLPQQIGIGLCQAMVPLVAYSYTKKDFARVKKLMGSFLKIGMCVSLVCLALYELLPRQIIRLFIADPATLDIGSDFLRVRSLAAVIMFFCFFLVFLFQALGNGKISTGLVVMRWCIINIPILFLFNSLFGMYGLVWAPVVSDFLTVLISYIFLHHYMKTWDKEDSG